MERTLFFWRPRKLKTLPAEGVCPGDLCSLQDLVCTAKKKCRKLETNIPRKVISPQWSCLFCWRKYVDRSWEYINRSQTHECGYWAEAARFPEKEYINGIAFAVCCPHPWMKEVKGIRHGGGGAYLRCPVFTTVEFSLRDEGSSEYIRVWRTMSVCYVTLSLTPSGLNLCQIVKTVHKT